MSFLEIVQVVIALLIIFFLPGFMLVNVLFPRRNELDEEDDLLYRIVLGIALSIVITVLNGFVLGTIGINPDTGKGYFTAFNIWITHAVYTVVFFVWAYYRGAFPLLGRGYNVELDQAISQDQRQKMYDLMDHWRELKLELGSLDRKLERSEGKAKKKLKSKRDRLFEDLREVDLSIKRLGRETHIRTTTTQELQELVHQWRRVRQEIKLCDERIEEGDVKVVDHFKNRKAKLQKELDEIDERILELRGE